METNSQLLWNILGHLRIYLKHILSPKLITVLDLWWYVVVFSRVTGGFFCQDEIYSVTYKLLSYSVNICNSFWQPFLMAKNLILWRRFQMVWIFSPSCSILIILKQILSDLSFSIRGATLQTCSYWYSYNDTMELIAGASEQIYHFEELINAGVVWSSTGSGRFLDITSQILYF